MSIDELMNSVFFFSSFFVNSFLWNSNLFTKVEDKLICKNKREDLNNCELILVLIFTR